MCQTNFKSSLFLGAYLSKKNAKSWGYLNPRFIEDEVKQSGWDGSLRIEGKNEVMSRNRDTIFGDYDSGMNLRRHRMKAWDDLFTAFEVQGRLKSIFLTPRLPDSIIVLHIGMGLVDGKE